MMIKWWRNLCQRAGASRPLTWQGDQITDDWFGSHFNYAADVVNDWLGDEVRQGRLLDFGCGDGITALGLVLRHGYEAVEGVDISTTQRGLSALAQRQIGLNRLPHGLRFKTIEVGQRVVSQKPFTAIMSWSVFEHVGQEFLRPVIANMYDLVAPGGVVFIQINPLYYSPQGSHLGRFQLPDWAHLTWSQEEVIQAVMAYKGEIPSAETEENFHTRTYDEYKAWVLREFEMLNRITAPQLRELFEAQGFELVREGHGKVPQVPPESLLTSYSELDLRTDEVRFLFKRPSIEPSR